MAENTSIGWCDHTFNPWIGCTKVSAGCANCYAEKLNERYKWCGFPIGNYCEEGATWHAKWGKGVERYRTSAANWRLPLKWNKDASPFNIFLTKRQLEYGEITHRRPRVFCGSLCDWLDDEVPVEWLMDLLVLIYKTPHLDWLLLTKRPENWRKRLLGATAGNWCDPLDIADRVHAWASGEREPLNVRLGTTVENQEMADKRKKDFEAIPALDKFVSYEPALGAVDWRGWEFVHQIISGGESGRFARPSHTDWHRATRDFCKANGIAYFFKQWGEWLPSEQFTDGHVDKNNDFAYVGEDGTVLTDDIPLGENYEQVIRVGKHAAGCLLDGKEHKEFPTP